MQDHTPELIQPQLPLDEIPYGYCHCGCGQITYIPAKSNKKRGLTKGEPARFVRGHATRLRPHPERPSDNYRWEQVPDVIDPDNLPQVRPIPDWQIEDLTGNIYGRLTVLGYIGKNRHDQSLWLCHCECGQYRVIVRTNLVSGHSNSCGCLAAENRLNANKTHGMTGTPEYRCWAAMINRCTSAGSTGYEHWGGRGITVCEHWRHNFANFFADLGAKPGRGHDYSIDRIDTNAHYSCGHCDQCRREGWPANCRWATPEQQLNNTTRNVHLEFQGERLTIIQWARKLHMHRDALYYRIRAGWDVERALTTPAKRYD